jgi:hypothetical protein
MQIKTTTERLEINQGDFPTLPPKSSKRRTLFPFAILFAMVCAILLMDAILPLRDLWFKEALLTQLGSWPVLPSRILFPGWPLIPPVPPMPVSPPPPRVIQSWEQLPLMLGSFVLVFFLYLLALRRLPAKVSRRFIFTSTVLLGFLYILIPIVTSRDLFSYIAYARIGVIHHLNPLTTLPTAIRRSDEIYNYVYWVDQPSAYGPTWVILTSSLQWLFTLFGLNNFVPMLIALRFLGLAMHLLSTLLIWKISGQLQRPNGIISPTTRLRATLAFAWNPLLLFEACVNAHNDTTLLPLILLAVWFLVRAPMGPILHFDKLTRTSVGADLLRPTPIYRPSLSYLVRDKLAPNAPFILAAAMLALATCLKINIVLLVPGLLLYAWTQEPVSGRLKRVVAVTATYTGLILLCYAPFWQGGAILHVLSVNPATYRTINTPADFLGHFYNSIMVDFGYPIGAPIGSPAERIMHTLSLSIFVIIYMLLCWRVIRRSGRISNVQGLLRWMAITWLVYCALGSPWFWPWYIITFFGLYALIEASSEDGNALFDLVRWPAGTETYFMRLLSFSMLSLYCFFVWGTSHSFVPGLPGFEWSYLSGLWAWVLPLVAVALLNKRPPGRPQGSPPRSTPPPPLL